MQFASRFNLTMDSDTVRMCREVKDNFCELSSERVCEEWRKWARGAHPSRGLVVLRETGWLDHFPALHMMLDVPQDPQRHPEGNVWIHTMLVVDQAASRGAGEAVMFAALLHDTGKAHRTEIGNDGRLHSFGHAQAGMELAKRFMEQLEMPKELTEKVIKLVGAHMWHLNGVSMSAARRWSRKVARRLWASW